MASHTFNVKKVVSTFVSMLGKPKVEVTVIRPGSDKAYRLVFNADDMLNVMGKVKDHIVREHESASMMKVKLDMALHGKN